MSKVVKIENGKLTVLINTLGAEITSVRDCMKKEFIWQADPKIWGRSGPVLFPICGGLKNNKYTLNGEEYTLEKHGFAKNKEFKIESHENDSVSLVLYDDAESMKSFPFQFKFTVIFKLCDNTLNISCITENLSDRTMYFSCGAHEGFATPEGIESYEILFEKPETLKAYKVEGTVISNEYSIITENSNVLNLKKDYFEVDALVFKDLNSRSLTLVNKDKSRSVKYKFDGFDRLLLWQVPGAGYLCIEPWTGFPDIISSSFEIEKKFSITTLEPHKADKCMRSITFS